MFIALTDLYEADAIAARPAKTSMPIAGKRSGATMFFSNSTWFWLLPFGLILTVIEARRQTRPWATGLLRGAVFAAMTLALSGPLVAWRDRSTTNVAIVDMSPAVSSEEVARVLKLLRSGTEKVSRVVAFASRAEVLDWPSASITNETIDAFRQRLARPLWSDDLTAGASNMADALRLAGAQVPVDGQGSVRLFAAGLNHHGDTAAEAWRLARRGIGVRTETMHAAPATPLVIQRVIVPTSARAGETVPAVVTFQSVSVGKATFSLTAGNAAPVVSDVNAVAGTNQITIGLPVKKPGLTPVSVSARFDGKPSADGNVLAAVYVEAAARVLLVYDAMSSDGDGNGAAAALTALLGPGATVEPVPASDLAGRTLSDTDVIVVADVSADCLPPAAQQALRRAVSDGTGLLFTGATRSFGPGGYADSALASLLPVSMPQSTESIDPSTSLVLIIDTSSSMQGEPIDLAKEIARLAVSHLKPHDKVGIVEFYGGRRWAAPLQSAGNLSVIHRAMNRLTAMGSTTLYPAVEEAAFALRNVQTRTKHVLICSDGLVEDAPFAALVRRMAKEGITVSTAQVAAPDKGPNLMADIARWGNGRYYVSPDQYGLPDISLKRPKTSVASPLVQTPSAIRAGDDALAGGVAPDAFGTIDGYVKTEAKPTADVLLKTENGDPLLVRWRYGAGFVAALPTQLGSAMSADLQNRPVFAKMLAGLFRQIGSIRGPALRLSAIVRPAGVEVDVAAADPHGSPDGAMTVTMTDSAGRTQRKTTAEAIELGHWNLLMPNVPTGTYTLTASLPGGPADGYGGVAVTVPQPSPSVDRMLLDEIAAFAPLAARRAAAQPDAAVRFLDARPLFAVMAAAALLIHVAVRRWPALGAIRAATPGAIT